MKYGVILPPGQIEDSAETSILDRIRTALVAWRNFILIVIVPTLVFSAYQFLIVADRFETTSEFLVKSGDNSQAPSSAIGGMLGIGVSSQSQSEILSVPDYLTSHEVVSALQKRMDLVGIFRRPEADVFTRLSEANPEPEILLKYYRSRVNVRHDSDTGIMHLSVQTFRPQDSFKIGQALLQLGEHKINEMNQRSYEDAVRSARTQLASAEDEAASVQRQITNFRQENQDVDPELSGQAQIKLISELNSRLASARAQLSTMAGVISRNSPQYIALSRQVKSLESEVSLQIGKMGDRNNDIARSLGEYEKLKVRQDFSAKNYAAAAANLQRAMEQARRQQLYFVHVVDPNLAVRSLYPKRTQLVLTLLAFLTISYGIGWLIIAGVREHEA